MHQLAFKSQGTNPDLTLVVTGCGRHLTAPMDYLGALWNFPGGGVEHRGFCMDGSVSAWNIMGCPAIFEGLYGVLGVFVQCLLL